MSWCIEPGTDPESGKPVWSLQDAPGERGTVVAYFYDRVAATACLRGFKAIGFVPERPRPKPPQKPAPVCPHANTRVIIDIDGSAVKVCNDCHKEWP